MNYNDWFVGPLVPQLCPIPNRFNRHRHGPPKPPPSTFDWETWEQRASGYESAEVLDWPDKWAIHFDSVRTRVVPQITVTNYQMVYPIKWIMIPLHHIIYPIQWLFWHNQRVTPKSCNFRHPGETPCGMLRPDSGKKKLRNMSWSISWLANGEKVYGWNHQTIHMIHIHTLYFLISISQLFVDFPIFLCLKPPFWNHHPTNQLTSAAGSIHDNSLELRLKWADELQPSKFFSGFTYYPLVNIQKTMENHHV